MFLNEPKISLFLFDDSTCSGNPYPIAHTKAICVDARINWAFFSMNTTAAMFTVNV